MRKHAIPYAVYFILLFLFILLPFHPDAFSSTHAVVKGDTLSSIAKSHLGSWRKWKDLAEWNELKTEWKKGIPYVLIRPGQKIRLESQWTEDRISRYQENTLRLLDEEIFRMANLKFPNKEFKGHREIENDVELFSDDVKLFSDDLHLHRHCLTTGNLGCQYDYRMAQLRLKRIQLRLKMIMTDMANMERLIIAEEIYDYSKMMPLHFFKDKLWVVHRKTAILLMAIMGTESHGRFVHGKHGERGIYQQKPETFWIAMGYKKEDLPEIEEALDTSHYVAMKCAIKLLKRGSSPYDALRRYNSGSDGKDRAYALKVLRVFYKMMARGV